MIFITGTAGSGKSLLTSRLEQWYQDRENSSIALNLDPAVEDLAYIPDIDIRNYIDIDDLKQRYGLGPNGSIIMAYDLIATKIQEIQDDISELNPEYVLVDTPGQIELFAYRSSGSYFVNNIHSENKATIFLMDGVLVSSPINFVSLSLLSTSINLRLKTAQINVLSKKDLILNNLENILEWTSHNSALRESLDKEDNFEFSLLSKDIIRNIFENGLNSDLIPVSNLTMNGFIDLSASLTRILNQGEEIQY
jgi:GTPase SAR1 family protein